MNTERFNPPYTKGLTASQVALRKSQGLSNITEDKITKTNGQIIRENVFTLFNAFNFAIALALAAVHAWLNMVYIIVIIANILIAIIQEIRGKNMVANLSLISAIKVTTVRDEKTCEVPVEELVLDDITLLEMGNQICADSIVSQGEIEVNESLLTGEADPILKKPGDALLSGSFVVSGKAYAKVEHVGADNFASHITSEAKEHKKKNSELIGSMRKVTKFTSYFIIPLGIILFLEAFFLRAQPLDKSIISTAAALLGMLPKGLVLLITFALAVGLIRLSKKRVLIQELHSIETFAHVDMLCLDKTGTITQGKMSVQTVHPINESALPIPIDKAMGYYIGAADDNNATFQALKEYFPNAETTEIISKTPFSSERKWGSVAIKDIGTLVLGAPEKLTSEKLPQAIDNAQKEGNRILCLGYSKLPITDGVLCDIALVAAIEFSDPLRANAKETLDFFKQEGVDVKVISGDNPITVSNIAKKAGLENYKNYIDLSQIKTEEDLIKAAKEYTIFGRVTPSQKRQLVKAFKSEGHTVAMTGDGVNDVLALKEADCSIAMAVGSDAAKQVSNLVLLDSDFSSLPDVVMEGRRVINNITRFGAIFLIKTILSALLALLCAVTITAYPFVPIQITLYDSMIEGYFTFLLSFENNFGRIPGAFLRNVIQKASPYAIVTLLNILVISIIYPHIGLSNLASETVMYYITASIGLFAGVMACRPFTSLRIFTFTTSIIGFFLAAELFKNLLQLQQWTFPIFGVFLICVIISIPLIFLVASWVNKLFAKGFAQKALSVPKS